MNLFSLLSFFASIIYIYLGVFAFRLDRKSNLNRMFLILCLSFGLWAFSYTFVYSANDKDAAWFWFKVSSLGWCTFAGIGLHFSLLLTKRTRALRTPWTYFFLYLPGIVFIFRAWTSVLTARDFIKTSVGWVPIMAPASVWLWLHTLYYSACMVIGISLTWQWGKQSTRMTEKRQANIVVYTAGTAFILGTLTNILFPVLQIHALPAIAPILVLIWAFGAYHAISKYRLMSLTPQIATDEIMSRMNDLLILTNPEGRISKLNSRVEALLGCYEKDLAGKPINMVVLEEKVIQEAFSTVKENAFSFYNHDATFKTQYGEHIPVNISCSAVRDAGGDSVGIVIIGQDMRQTHQLYEEIVIRKRTEDALMRAQTELETRVEQRTGELALVNSTLQTEIAEHRKAEEELKNSERRLSDIIDHLPDATFVINRDGKVIAWNKATEQMTNIVARDVIGKGDHEHALPFFGKRVPLLSDLALSPEDESTKVKYPHVKRDRHTLYTEIFVRSLRGKSVYLWAVASPLYDSSGGIAGAIETIRDVTERRHMEEAFKAEKERFKALSEHSPFGLVLLDRDGVFKYINPKFKEIFGYDLDDVPDGRTWFRKAFPDPDYRHKAISTWISNFKDFKPGEGYPGIFTTLCKDGSQKTVNLVPVQLESGEFLMTCEDITALKKLEVELRALSLTDELTGLYNRRGFFTLGAQQLKMAERIRKGMVLVYADIDNLKQINDVLGHREGDNALIAASNVLRETFRESDVIARIGGDEFVVLAMEAGEHHGQALTTRLMDRLNDYNSAAGQAYDLFMSIGIAHYNSDGPADLDKLLKLADDLMYDKKRKNQPKCVIK